MTGFIPGPADTDFLRPQWDNEVVPTMRLTLKYLRLFRRATLDLLLTRMTRGNDEQVMQDIDFVFRHDRLTHSHIEGAFREVVIPDNQELREAFARARPTVLSLAAKAVADSYTLPGR